MTKQEIIVDETSERFRAFFKDDEWEIYKLYNTLYEYEIEVTLEPNGSEHERIKSKEDVIQFRKYLMTFYPGLTDFKQFHDDLQQLHDETIIYPGIFRENNNSLSAHIKIYSYSCKNGRWPTIDYCRQNIELTQECVDLVQSEIREHIKNARILIDTKSNSEKFKCWDGGYISTRDIDHMHINVIERWITPPQ
jgi:hypothetical protein